MPKTGSHTSKREIQRVYRSRHKAMHLSYTPQEMAEIEEAAKKLGMTRAKFVKACVYAHIHGNGYVVPKDSQVREVIVAIHRVGNLVNQLVRYCHETRSVTYANIELIQGHLRSLHDDVTQYLTRPRVKDIPEHTK